MIVGVPREVKSDEYRVAMLPSGVEELVSAGHQVILEQGAGLGSGIADSQYAESGATIVKTHTEVFAAADMIVKVKEPQVEEWALLRTGQIIFTYFHFAADEELTRNVLATGATAVAYETLRGRKGDLPLLTPMSEVAGRMSIQKARSIWNARRKVVGFCSAEFPVYNPLISLFWVAAWWVRMRLRSQPGFRRMSPFWTSASIACATLKTSCLPTLIRSSATVTVSANSYGEQIW